PPGPTPGLFFVSLCIGGAELGGKGRGVSWSSGQDPHSSVQMTSLGPSPRGGSTLQAHASVTIRPLILIRAQQVSPNMARRIQKAGRAKLRPGASASVVDATVPSLPVAVRLSITLRRFRSS